MDAISYVADMKTDIKGTTRGEATSGRFDRIVGGLAPPPRTSPNTEVPPGADPLQTACLQLVNALLHPQFVNIDYRVHLRNEIMRDGLLDLLDVRKRPFSHS